MTHEEINIAIAEACGWTNISNWKAAGINGLHPSKQWTEVIPDYCNDLNAMHEAEKTLRRDQQNFYMNYLSDMVDDECPVKHDFDWCCATAHQRAEAFLRTLNLYTQ